MVPYAKNRFARRFLPYRSKRFDSWPDLWSRSAVYSSGSLVRSPFSLLMMHSEIDARYVEFCCLIRFAFFA